MEAGDTARKANSRNWCGSFELVVLEDGLLPLPPEVAECLGLVPGDILCLDARFPWVLGMNIYRMNLECWGEMTEYHPSLWPWIETLLNRPMTAVEPGVLPIPLEVFPLGAGERFELRPSTRWGVLPVDLQLWRGEDVTPRPPPR